MARDPEEYDAWIADYVASGMPVLGECMAVCRKMKERFPELNLHGGYVRMPFGTDLHYWLTTPEGALVDPTASQFGDWEVPWPEGYEDAGTTDPMKLLRRFIITLEDSDEAVATG